MLAQSWVALAYIDVEPRPSMNPWANTGCSTPKPAAVPTYMATASGPCSSTMARTRRPISALARSQLTRRQSSPTRSIGWVSRSGERYISCWRTPLMQAKPPVATCSSSGRILVTAPASTVTSSPHRDSQIRQNVYWVLAPPWASGAVAVTCAPARRLRSG